LGQRLGAAHDLHDLGGDGFLAGPVHLPAQRLDELLGVVGGRLHGPLTGGVLRGGGVEHGGEEPGLDVARQQPFEDAVGRRLELVVGLWPRALLGQRLGLQRHEAAHDDLLRARRDELGVDQLDLVDVALVEALHDLIGDFTGILVGRLLAEAGEGDVDAIAPEAEVVLALLAAQDQRVVAPLLLVGPQRLLGGADDAGVVAARQAPVGGDHDEADLADLLARREQGLAPARTGARQVADDGGDLLAVGAGGLDTLLGLDDAAGRDQLHGARDLLGRLNRLDPSPQDPLLPTRQSSTPPPRWRRSAT
jgi:hypothetical protein